MKNGKENILNEISTNLLEKVGGGWDQNPSAPQTVINASANANANGNYSYNVGVTFTVSPSTTPSISIGAGIGGNNNQPLENMSVSGVVSF
jgi:hypothetical protein